MCQAILLHAPAMYENGVLAVVTSVLANNSNESQDGECVALAGRQLGLALLGPACEVKLLQHAL